ncbi:MAG: hypothetical protein HUU35_06515 [Armatimonadetes bacterium]|nr:hypothetical protein [Armatimonadota bacterium]
MAGPEGLTTLTLPGLLARLLSGPEIDAFPALAADQRGYWWRFLVRCAEKALTELGTTVAEAAAMTPDDLAEMLGEVLAGLVPKGGWCLYQPEAARPGFLQVPAPGGRTDDYKPKSVAALTGLIGTANHERKAGALRSLPPEQVVYALVEYQTAANYGGSGNYQSQLMGSRSGAGSGTPFMGVWLGQSHQETFRHDVATLQATGRGAEAALQGQVWALWTLPWSGNKGDELNSEELDPAFIPLARLVRLGPPRDGRFVELLFKSTDAGRVLDHTTTPVGNDLKGGGLLGDPFTPTVVEPMPKIRGTLEKGYDYAEIVGLLYGGDKFRGPSPSVTHAVEGRQIERDDLAVVFEGVAYSQGKTLGFHRRVVPLPALGASFMDDPAPVRAVHGPLLELVSNAKKAVRDAAHIILSGTDEAGRPKRRDSAKARADRAVEMLDQRVDAVYLRYLLEAAAEYRDGRQEGFETALVAWLQRESRAVFQAARENLPCCTNQRLQRELLAERWLNWQLARLAGERAPAEADEEGSSDE